MSPLNVVNAGYSMAKGTRMARKVFHVVPDQKEGWRVTGGSRTVATGAMKSVAVARARKIARQSPSSQLIVHKRDGTIQTEYTYGNDPFPPKG
jgi:hypothetical protein